MLNLPIETKKKRPVHHEITKEDDNARKFLYDLIFTETKRTHPNVPYPAKPKPINITKTNGMEFAARELFRLHGYKLQSHKVKGQQITPDTNHYDFTGKLQIKEKGKWRRASEETGTADQYGTCRDKKGNVMSLKVETKNFYTKDIIKPHQEERRQEWIAAGGTHVYMTTFSQFLEWCFDNVRGIDRF